MKLTNLGAQIIQRSLSINIRGGFTTALKIKGLKVEEGTARMTFLEGYELLDQIGEGVFGYSIDF